MFTAGMHSLGWIMQSNSGIFPSLILNLLDTAAVPFSKKVYRRVEDKKWRIEIAHGGIYLSCKFLHEDQQNHFDQHGSSGFS